MDNVVTDALSASKLLTLSSQANLPSYNGTYAGHRPTRFILLLPTSTLVVEAVPLATLSTVTLLQAYNAHLCPAP